MYKFIIQRDGVQSSTEFDAPEDCFYDLEWFDTQDFPWQIDIAKEETPADILREDPEASFIYQSFVKFYKDGEANWKTTIDWYEKGVHRMRVTEDV